MRRLTVSIRPYKEARSSGLSPLTLTNVASARCYRHNKNSCLSSSPVRPKLSSPEGDIPLFQYDHTVLINEVLCHLCYSINTLSNTYNLLYTHVHVHTHVQTHVHAHTHTHTHTCWLTLARDGPRSTNNLTISRSPFQAARWRG